MVFKYPEEPERDFIKRVIGLPGETLELREKKVYINGHAARRAVRALPASRCHRRLGVPRGDVVRRPRALRAGDGAGRPVFRDGRQPRQLAGQPLLGVPAARANIKGKALVIYWSYEAEREDYQGEGPARAVKRVGVGRSRTSSRARAGTGCCTRSDEPAHIEPSAATAWRGSSDTTSTSVRDRLRVAEDGRADPHHRGALLDGDLEIVAHAHRELGELAMRSTPRATRSSRSAPERGEVGARAFGIYDGRRQQHQPGQSQRACTAPRPRRSAVSCVGRRRRAWSVRRRGPPGSGAPAGGPPRAPLPSSSATERAIVHRVDRRRKRPRPSAPCSTEDGRPDASVRARSEVLLDLPERFLNLVLAEIESVRRRQRRGRDRREMSWRSRRGESRQGRARPGGRRARCVRGRRPAGRGARRSCATS